MTFTKTLSEGRYRNKVSPSLEYIEVLMEAPEDRSISFKSAEAWPINSESMRTIFLNIIDKGQLCKKEPHPQKSELDQRP